MEHNNTNNKNGKKYSICQYQFFDKMYDKLVLSVTKLDSGNVFKFIMVLTIHVLSFAILLGLPIAFLIAAFGEYGFINAGFKGDYCIHY